MEKIAIISHDGKKPDMVAFVKDNLHLLSEYDLTATGTTGSHIEKAGLRVEKNLSGPKGGDAQIAAQVAEGKIHAVIFLRDPLGKHPHDPDISMLMRVCDVHNVPIFTNLKAAQIYLEYLYYKKKCGES